MDSVGKVIDRVQSLYSKGVKSDDSRLSSRHIYSVIKSVRSQLFTEKINKNQSISPWNYDTIPCVEMISIQPNLCPCETPPGCKILRSKYKIPAMLHSYSGPIIKSINSLDLSGKRYSLVAIQEVKNQAGNKYTSNIGNAFFYGDYLFLSAGKESKVLSITALFDDMFEVYNFLQSCETDCNNCNCESFLDKDFRSDQDTLNRIIRISSEELIGLFNQNLEDKTNNTSDNLIEQSK